MNASLVEESWGGQTGLLFSQGRRRFGPQSGKNDID